MAANTAFPSEGHKVYGRTLTPASKMKSICLINCSMAVKKMLIKAVLKQSEHIANTLEFSSSTNAFYPFNPKQRADRSYV